MSLYGPHPDDEEIYPPMSDLQMAFAQSQIDEATRERTPAEVENFERIQSALAAGRHVVCHIQTICCRSTDAILGSRNWHHADFATFAEAEFECRIMADTDEYGDGITILSPPGFVPPRGHVNDGLF